MAKYNQRTSVSLTQIARTIHQILSRVKNHGWFSEWISQKLVEDFGSEKKILIEMLRYTTKERNILEKEIKTIVKKLKRCKK